MRGPKKKRREYYETRRNETKSKRNHTKQNSAGEITYSVCQLKWVTVSKVVDSVVGNKLNIIKEFLQVGVHSGKRNKQKIMSDQTSQVQETRRERNEIPVGTEKRMKKKIERTTFFFLLFYLLSTLSSTCVRSIGMATFS